MQTLTSRRAKLIFNKLAIALIIYELIFQVGSSMIFSFGTDIFTNPYVAMILAAILALVSAYLILGTEAPALPRKPFRLRSYLWLLLLFYGLQFISSLLTNPLEALLQSLGFALEDAAAAAAGTEPLEPFMLVYSIILAPLFEECLFRGLVFNPLRRFGRCFAILVTALLFGLMHANILQFIAAFLLGILLAWIRENYGLRRSILLHITNNALAILFNNFYQYPAVALLSTAVLLLGLAVLCITLVLNSRKMLSALREEDTLRENLFLFFTSISVIVLIIVFLLLTVLNLS